ncbi:nucleoside hydrolase [Lentibacillus jeotgali]|uniref:nucleoside hydrolase n=1 Tax=Lentibacillus jeotgali TaxID=558169 RepID=UPI0002628F88|nr:nucleoside hydrolase [Lentibacillus jeotgali]
MTNNRKIIMDCDPGHDDALAIILAASKISPLTIEAITTVSGNVDVEKNTLNALKICDMIGLDETPVAKGADRPLFKEREVAEEIHGETGLDGPVLPEKPTKELAEVHAVDVIIEKVLNSNQNVTLVATGPLTNVALAIRKDPRIVPKIEEIVLMGGGTFGNWTPAAEFNIYVDAEAAKIVFDSDIPIAMFGLDVTHQAIANRDIMNDFKAIGNPVAQFAADLLDFFLTTNEEVFGLEGGPVHDACTIAYLIQPSLFDLKHVRVDIETKGEFTYGMTSVDMLGVTGKQANVTFAQNLNRDGFWELFNDSLKSYG